MKQLLSRSLLLLALLGGAFFYNSAAGFTDNDYPAAYFTPRIIYQAPEIRCEIKPACHKSASLPKPQSAVQHREWIVFLLSFFAGLSSYVSYLRTSAASWQALGLAGELITSVFTGFLIFWFSDSMAIEWPLALVFIGVAAHMGGRVVMMLEKRVIRLID